MSTLDAINAITTNTVNRLDPTSTPAPSLNHAEEREWQRYYDIRGTVALNDPETDQKTTGHILDISAGGMAFRAPLELAVHSYTTLDFEIPGFRMTVQLFILRKEGFKYAGRFVRVSDSLRRIIDGSLKLAKQLQAGSK